MHGHALEAVSGGDGGVRIGCSATATETPAVPRQELIVCIVDLSFIDPVTTIYRNLLQFTPPFREVASVAHIVRGWLGESPKRRQPPEVEARTQE
jgi:hypothetical protein